jgi:hypothetical protein
MLLDTPSIEQGLALAARVHEKYKPVWEKLGPREAAALALYFLPHSSNKPVLSPKRPRMVKWYCPFADQRAFPSGHRYCINVYTGCEHDCQYCYAKGYEPNGASCKRHFVRYLCRDLDDLETYDLPAAPVHLSNSTDPFQSLELETGHTRSALEQILRHRRRFTSVVLLTKNPRLAAQPQYLEVLRKLLELPEDHLSREDFTRQGFPGLRVEVSLAFWRDDARACFDLAAPTVQDRMDGVRQLRQAAFQSYSG